MSRARRIEIENEILRKKREKAGVKVLRKDEFVRRFIRDQANREPDRELAEGLLDEQTEGE